MFLRNNWFRPFGLLHWPSTAHRKKTDLCLGENGYHGSVVKLIWWHRLQQQQLKIVRNDKSYRWLVVACWWVCLPLRDYTSPLPKSPSSFSPSSKYSKASQSRWSWHLSRSSTPRWLSWSSQSSLSTWWSDHLLSKSLNGFVKVVTWICQRCSVYFSPFAHLTSPCVSLESWSCSGMLQLFPHTVSKSGSNIEKPFRTPSQILQKRLVVIFLFFLSYSSVCKEKMWSEKNLLFLEKWERYPILWEVRKLLISKFFFDLEKKTAVLSICSFASERRYLCEREKKGL